MSRCWKGHNKLCCIPLGLVLSPPFGLHTNILLGFLAAPLSSSPFHKSNSPSTLKDHKWKDTPYCISISLERPGSSAAPEKSKCRESCGWWEGKYRASDFQNNLTKVIMNMNEGSQLFSVINLDDIWVANCSSKLGRVQIPQHGADIYRAIFVLFCICLFYFKFITYSSSMNFSQIAHAYYTDHWLLNVPWYSHMVKLLSL